MDISPKKTHTRPADTWNKCSKSPIIRDVNTKPTVKYHLTFLRITNMQKTTTKHALVRIRRGRGNLVHCGWNCRWVQPLWKTAWRFLKKLKIKLPYGPTIPLLGIYPKKMNPLIWKDTSTPMFIAAFSTITKIWKQPSCACVYTHTHTHRLDCYSNIKENEILPFVAAWMDLEGIMLSEISQRKTHTVLFHS